MNKYSCCILAPARATSEHGAKCKLYGQSDSAHTIFVKYCRTPICSCLTVWCYLINPVFYVSWRWTTNAVAINLRSVYTSQHMLHNTLMFCPGPGHCAVFPSALHQGQHHQQYSRCHRQTGRHCGLWKDGGWGWAFQRSEDARAIAEKSGVHGGNGNTEGMQNCHREMSCLISWKIYSKFTVSSSSWDIVALMVMSLHRYYRVIYRLYTGLL